LLKLFSLLKPLRGSVAIVTALALAQSLANLYLPRLAVECRLHAVPDDGLDRGSSADQQADWDPVCDQRLLASRHR